MRIRRLIPVGLLLGISPAMAAHVIPFKDLDGLVEVEASVDNQAAIPVLVDLGAGLDVLAGNVRTTVTPAGLYTGFRLSGKRIDLTTGTAGSITLGDYRIDHPLVATWKDLDNAPVKGLVAATAFRTAKVRFDFVRHELVVFDSAAEIASSSQRVPIVLLDDRGIALTTFARFDFGRGVSGLCEIDTGSQGFFLNARLAQKLGIDLKDPSLKHAGNAADGNPVVAEIPQVALEGAPSTTIAHPKAMFGNYIYDCNIGNQFWKGRSFTLDIPGKALFVSVPKT